MRSLAVLFVTLCVSQAAVIVKDNCAPGYFECANGLCIPDQLVCDGVYDCVTGSDEDEFNCASGEDECAPGFFDCANGLCIPDVLVCDGVYDCLTGVDEVNCTSVVTNSPTTEEHANECSSENMYTCNNGLCIPAEFVCDGVYNCVNGDDEIGCSAVTDADEADEHANECSSENMYTCNNGLCIPAEFVCDGVYNCVNGDDEIGCSAGTSDPQSGGQA